MSGDLTTEFKVLVPEASQASAITGSGIAIPHEIDTIAQPENAGKVITPRGYTPLPEVLIPSDRDLKRYVDQKKQRESIKPADVVRALGNFDVYFNTRVQEFFPSNTATIPATASSFERRTEKKSYYDRTSGTREEREVSSPGPIEEQCVTALRIATTPGFAGTGVDSLAIEKATTLIQDGRKQLHGEDSLIRLPEMPDLLREAQNYIRRPSLDRKARFATYTLLDHIDIPQSEIPQLFALMAKNRDWAHPLYARVKSEAYAFYVSGHTGQETWRQEQATIRTKLLQDLGQDMQTLMRNYDEYKKQAAELVCSVDPENPPHGKVGFEVEFGMGDSSISEPQHFRSFNDGENREIVRGDRDLNFNAAYLQDLAALQKYLRRAATHVSSLHIHLDREVHPVRPDMGNLLGNNEGCTVEENGVNGTWEVRGLLPPTYIHGTELDAAALADLMQLYISASEPVHDAPHTPLALPERRSVSVEQIIFAHICRTVQSPEGRLAALKALEHPLSLRTVNPKSLIEAYETIEDKRRVYDVLKEGLQGRYARKSLRSVARSYGFEGTTIETEPLTDTEITEQYQRLVAILTKTGLLQLLPSGEMGAVDIDGNSDKIPSIDHVLQAFHENQDVLGPKMEQGFRRLLIVPGGMKIEDIAARYVDALRAHHADGRLLATKDDPSDSDKKLDLDTREPIWVWGGYHGADVSGNLVYYPLEFSSNHQGKTKRELLASQGTGWRVLLVEDLPNLPGEGTGETIGGRTQLEANRSPRDYLQTLTDLYAHEVGFTPEDWLTYALTHLEETDQVVDDWQGEGKLAYLPGAYFRSGGLVPYASWTRGLQEAYLLSGDPGYRSGYNGVRVAVRVI